MRLVSRLLWAAVAVPLLAWAQGNDPDSTRVDPYGYIAFCPCMGRFGNQADHFLGTLAFAKALNRTLVVPPWVEYRYQQPRSIQVPFKTYFEVEALQEYHQAITMEEFMSEIAPLVWPPEKRVSFCYMARGDSDDCNAKDGNPFGPFWDTFNVDFVSSQFYGPLTYDTQNPETIEKWNSLYPPDKWPVLAFVGAPASFPIQEENRHLQQYLVWSWDYETRAQQFIRDVLPKGAFVAIHLRNGADWLRACEHVKHSPNLMASPQCLGYNNQYGKVTHNLCLPSEADIVKKVRWAVKTVKAKSVFVASDHNHMIPELTKALARIDVSVHKLEPSEPHLDLAISGHANYFVGNCVSSFTAFIKRERDSRGLPSAFFSFPEKNSKLKHDEF